MTTAQQVLFVYGTLSITYSPRAAARTSLARSSFSAASRRPPLRRTEAPMRVKTNKQAVDRLFNEVWNGRMLEVIEELYSATFVADYRPYVPLREGHRGVR